MIEDAKLRELFKAESEDHLQHLDDACFAWKRRQPTRRCSKRHFARRTA